jgi:cold shock protein
MSGTPTALPALLLSFRLNGVTYGRVKRFSDEEGWGVLAAPDVPGEIWVHFSSIEMDGYRNLVEGQQVELDYEHYPPGQDGYFYRARRVRPL